MHKVSFPVFSHSRLLISPFVWLSVVWGGVLWDVRNFQRICEICSDQSADALSQYEYTASNIRYWQCIINCANTQPYLLTFIYSTLVVYASAFTRAGYSSVMLSPLPMFFVLEAICVSAAAPI